MVSMKDTTGPGLFFGFISLSAVFHPRSPGLEGSVDVYSVFTHITARLCKFVSVQFGGMDHLYFFIQICIRA